MCQPGRWTQQSTFADNNTQRRTWKSIPACLVLGFFLPSPNCNPFLKKKFFAHYCTFVARCFARCPHFFVDSPPIVRAGVSAGVNKCQIVLWSLTRRPVLQDPVSHSPPPKSLALHPSAWPPSSLHIDGPLKFLL